VTWGILVVYDPDPEVAKRYPTREFRSGQDWLTENGKPMLFDCPHAAAQVSRDEYIRRPHDTGFVSYGFAQQFVADTARHTT
jgi:hypothetical protein